MLIFAHDIMYRIRFIEYDQCSIIWLHSQYTSLQVHELRSAQTYTYTRGLLKELKRALCYQTLGHKYQTTCGK